MKIKVCGMRDSTNLTGVLGLSPDMVGLILTRIHKNPNPFNLVVRDLVQCTREIQRASLEKIPSLDIPWRWAIENEPHHIRR